MSGMSQFFNDPSFHRGIPFVVFLVSVLLPLLFSPRHKNRGKLSDLVAEHLDHLHYLNDILIINCEFLSDVLTDHLLNRLFLPLYVYSLVNPETVRSSQVPYSYNPVFVISCHFNVIWKTSPCPVFFNSLRREKSTRRCLFTCYLK